MRKENENKNIVIKQETEPVGAILIAHRAQRKCLKHNPNGITLVALVITIIVLLILAGVTINLTLGERGIFRLAEKAAKNYRDSQQEEMYGLNSLQNEINDTISEIGQGATNTETSTVPNGETVEANSITTWLKCAKIEDKYSYTTLEQVVADNACMESLMNNENAMKYLERSTEFADGICANESAMTHMGQSAYVDDTVLNNDVWVEKIAMSPYWNKVSNISVVLHGGASETITINGLYSSPTVTTNSAGDVNYQLPIGKFTFFGSVSGKSFERTISKKTTEVKVMPEGALYWYGNECSWITGGWSPYSVKARGGFYTNKAIEINNEMSMNVVLSNTTKNGPYGSVIKFDGGGIQSDVIEGWSFCDLDSYIPTPTELRNTGKYSWNNKLYVGSFGGVIVIPCSKEAQRLYCGYDRGRAVYFYAVWYD